MKISVRRLLGMGVAFLISINGTARAEVCSTIDLRDARPELGQFFHTPRDQYDLGWCYAYAAADLLSYRLGIPISGADLAFSYNFEISKDGFSSFIRNPSAEDRLYQSGLPKKASAYAIAHGVCPESVIPSELWAEVLKGLQACMDAVHSGRASPEEVLDWQVDQTSCRTFVQRVFPKVDPVAVMRSIANSPESNVNALFFRAAQASCANQRIRLPRQMEFKVRNALPFHPEAINGWIDQELENGVPVGIVYDPASFVSDSPGFPADLFVGHVSVVMGRQLRDGQCKYLVRNSWGGSCYYYTDRIRKDCLESEGAFWVSSTDLMQTLDYIVYLP